MFLTDLGTAELLQEVDRGRSPKWSSMCLLRAVGAPTLEALLIQSETACATVREAIQSFAVRARVDHVMLRTDRQKETKSYLRGGNSYRLDQGIEVALELLKGGRTIIVLEPTDRLTNHVTISFAVEPDGRWCAELLGPGFDASNLQRGDVPPEYIVSGLPLDPTGVSSPSAYQITVSRVHSVTMQERIAARLVGITEHILPSYGADFRGWPDELGRATEWMKTHGYNQLFRDTLFTFPFRTFGQVFEIVQLVHQFRIRQERISSFVLSSSVLLPSRIVFWDVTDGERKWGGA